MLRNCILVPFYTAYIVIDKIVFFYFVVVHLSITLYHYYDCKGEKKHARLYNAVACRQLSTAPSN